MKVYAKNGKYYLIEVEDGHREALVIRDLGDDTFEFFPRTHIKEAIIGRGYWESPTSEETERISRLLADRELPGPDPITRASQRAREGQPEGA